MRHQQTIADDKRMQTHCVTHAASTNKLIGQLDGVGSQDALRSMRSIGALLGELLEELDQTKTITSLANMTLIGHRFSKTLLHAVCLAHQVLYKVTNGNSKFGCPNSRGAT